MRSVPQKTELIKRFWKPCSMTANPWQARSTEAVLLDLMEDAVGEPDHADPGQLEPGTRFASPRSKTAFAMQEANGSELR